MRRVAVVALAALLLAGACSRKPSGVAGTLAAQNKVAMRSVRLYYESQGMLLGAETRNIALPENVAAAIPLVVRELMKGPATPALSRIFPADTVVRAAYLLPGGTVIVDLGGNTLTQGWGTGTHTELMAATSLVHTLTANFADAQRVRLVINGVPAETLGGHISLTRSLGPMPGLVEPASR